MRRIAQDDGFSLMPGKNCQRMTEHLQSPTRSEIQCLFFVFVAAPSHGAVFPLERNGATPMLTIC